MKLKPQDPNHAKPYNISLSPRLNSFVEQFTEGRTGLIKDTIIKNLIQAFDLHLDYFDKKHRQQVLDFACLLAELESIQYYDRIKDPKGNREFDRFYIKMKGAQKRAVVLQGYTGPRAEIPFDIFEDGFGKAKIKLDNSNGSKKKGKFYQNLEAFLETRNKKQTRNQITRN